MKVLTFATFSPYYYMQHEWETVRKRGLPHVFCRISISHRHEHIEYRNYLFNTFFSRLIWTQWIRKWPKRRRTTNCCVVECILQLLKWKAILSERSLFDFILQFPSLYSRICLIPPSLTYDPWILCGCQWKWKACYDCSFSNHLHIIIPSQYTIKLKWFNQIDINSGEMRGNRRMIISFGVGHWKCHDNLNFSSHLKCNTSACYSPSLPTYMFYHLAEWSYSLNSI